MSDAQHDYETFDEILHHWAKHRGDSTAFEQDGRTTTYAEFDDLSHRVIALFAQHGVGKGDRIAWLGKNSDAYGILTFAAARVGVVMVPVGWRLAQPEIAYIIGDTGAKLVFVEDAFLDAARTASQSVAGKPEVIEAHAALEQARALEPASYDPAGPEEAVLQLYTSGTTGNPKGAVLSNANLLRLRIEGNRAGLPWNEYREGDAMLVA
ncbi:MAG: AMP-binding protein, partial [Erythrobacter sp.]